MIRPRGVIFTTGRNKLHRKQKAFKDWDGDSGVGQAPEFPSQPLKNREFTGQVRPRFFYTSHLLSKFGSLLIFISLAGFLLTYGPILKVEVGYRLSRMFYAQPKGSFGDLLINKGLLEETEGVPDPQFSLSVPKIHAKGKIIANVDPSSESDYFAALRQGVAHAAGTAFPGEGKTIYLFAHSTDSPINILRYNAIFYLLKELAIGDEVDIYYGGVKYRYRVTDTKIVDPTATTYLTKENEQGQELLILQTCWPPGTTLRRLLVFAAKL